MINAGKEFSNVAFQHPARVSIVSTYFSEIGTETVTSTVGSLPQATGIRVRNEGGIEKWIQFTINRVAEEAVTDVGFVNIPLLGVTDPEVLISAVNICVALQILMQRQNVVHETRPELLYVPLSTLSYQKLAPG